MTGITQRICAQHRDLATVLKVLAAIVDGPLHERRGGEIDRLHEICYYLRVFPDRLHHPDEERHVYGPLGHAAPAHAALLDRIRAEHERCEPLTAQLHETVLAFERGEADAARLREVAHEYLDFQYQHMRQEEDEVLPLVERYLDDQSRSRAAAVFALHSDPLFGDNLAIGFEALRRRILARV